jgi:hypothetical protein
MKTPEAMILQKEREIELLQYRMNKYIRKIQSEQYGIKKQIEFLKSQTKKSA